MTPERANAVYDILVREAGAPESQREDFIFYHIAPSTDPTHLEWRFQGKLGFGGKYRGRKNRVTCYREDETPVRLEIIRKVNELLEEFTRADIDAGVV